MRIPVEIAVILLLLVLGWQKSYRDHLSQIFPDRMLPSVRSVSSPPAAPASQPPYGRNSSR